MIKAGNLVPLFLSHFPFFFFLEGHTIDKFNKYHNSICKATPKLFQLLSIKMIPINYICLSSQAIVNQKLIVLLFKSEMKYCIIR